MKLITVVAIIHVFYVVTDARNTTAKNDKAVICFYMFPMSDSNSTLQIEDIDAKICTHLWVDNNAMGDYSNQYFEQNNTIWTPNSNGTFQKFQKLKKINPDLKLIVQMPSWVLEKKGNVWGSSGSSNITENSIRLLKEMKFDGIDIDIDYFPPDVRDEIADTFCELTPGFRKNDLILTTTLQEISGNDEELPDGGIHNYTKIARCSDLFIIAPINGISDVTQRFSSTRKIKLSVERHIGIGVPSQKIAIGVPTNGFLFALSDPHNTEPGGRIDFGRTPMIGEDARGRGFISHRDLMGVMDNSSLEWNIRRDEETREPYAITKTGLWATYDDSTSMEFKANYVTEKGLGGIGTIYLNYEDSKGIGGAERFPLTRAAYNTVKGGHQSVDTNS